MKKRAFKKTFLATGSILFFFFLAGTEAPAQGPQANGPPRVEIAELEKAIQLLENPEEVKHLASQLKALVEARKQQLEKEETEGEGQALKGPGAFFGMGKLYGLYEERVIKAINELLSGIQKIPLRLKQLRNYISREENFQEMRSIAIQLLASLLAGIGVWVFLRSLTRRRLKKWGPGEPAGWREKLGVAFFYNFMSL
jgi:hypothetical protein